MNKINPFKPATAGLRMSICGILLGALTGTTSPSFAQLPIVDPTSVGMDETRLAGIEDLVAQGIQEKKMPGCVVCVGRHGKIAYLRAFGHRKIVDGQEPMTTDTVFDMASITKPVATATSIMKLVEDGKLRLGDRVVKFFPNFGSNGKDQITVQDLLIHQSGLIPDNALKDYLDGPEKAWERICDLGLVAPVGETFKYSDVNFIVLAKLVEAISGKNIHEYSKQNVFGPLQMRETGFLPSEDLRRRAATTQERNGAWMRGEVHDPRAYELGGIAGHAGLFSTAADLAIYARMMLERGAYRTSDGSENRILAPNTVAKMTSGFRVSSGMRGLGWDKQTGYSSNRGDLLSKSAFGHGGFTGTVLWMDPELDLFFILLSNRVHPNGKGSVNHLAGQILNLVASSVANFDPDDTKRRVDQPVSTGIDVLTRDQFRQLASQRVGLITNHTGRNRDGQNTANILHQSPIVELTALFSPEHGFAGQLDQSNIANAAEPQTGLTVFSLYGETRRPTQEMLENVDTLVFDIQDIGTRFYTYISTMGEAMQAAAEFDKRFVVLDRPNPIGGDLVAGPMLDPGKESFVGFHHLPVRHGMTTGELALMLAAERKLDLDLHIVPCEGWTRSATWEQTNLTWVNPSPNMRSLVQAFLYPGIGLLETTNVSVGRGTDTPFEILGAPWIDGRQLAAELHQRKIAGVRFVPIEFVPESSKYAGEKCGGINITLLARSQLRPVRLGLEIATALRRLYPKQWNVQNLNRLLGNEEIRDSILAGLPFEETWMKSQSGMRAFLRRRAAFLLYE